MTITSTKSWKNYIMLCNTLERNDISFESNDKELCVKCGISGRDIEQNFLFSINPSKMLITLFSPIPVNISEGNTTDIAIAVCIINNKLPDGCFCIDTNEGFIYFKMTTSFYESNVSERVFEYMLSSAADSIDEYYPKIQKLAERASMNYT